MASYDHGMLPSVGGSVVINGPVDGYSGASEFSKMIYDFFKNIYIYIFFFFELSIDFCLGWKHFSIINSPVWHKTTDIENIHST